MIQAEGDGCGNADSREQGLRASVAAGVDESPAAAYLVSVDAGAKHRDNLKSRARQRYRLGDVHEHPHFSE